ncbi:MAG: alpha/beta hydrolase [bacterium]|nr:alpha/beta hydrolase [bacterium]
MPGALRSALALAALRLPENLAQIVLLGRRKTLGWRVMDAKAQLVGQAINAVRVPGELPSVHDSREQMRAMTARLDRPHPKLAHKENRSIPGPEGDIAVRVYKPRDAAPRLPVLCYFHGGGWVQGDLDTHDGVCGKLAAWGQCLVVSVDYRLAPEHKFPAAVDDAIAAYKWLVQNANQFGGNPERVGVAGDSAGGNLSAALCQAIAEQGGRGPRCQVLIYPALDFRLNTQSHDELRDAYVIPRERIVWYTEMYLKDPSQSRHVRASPLLALDLRGQPPAYIVTCGFDPLRDEGASYSEKLRAAGVEVRHREFEGQIHAFVSLTRAIPQGEVCLREIGEYLQANL